MDAVSLHFAKVAADQTFPGDNQQNHPMCYMLNVQVGEQESSHMQRQHQATVLQDSLVIKPMVSSIFY